MPRLKTLKIQGWKSIRDAEIEFGDVTVLIGANGSGKSNLLSFFRLINEMGNGHLQGHIAKLGGANSVLHYGVSATDTLKFSIQYATRDKKYEFSNRMSFRQPDSLVIDEEIAETHGTYVDSNIEKSDFKKSESTILMKEKADRSFFGRESGCVPSCHSFQFHDTSFSSKLRLTNYINDNNMLNFEAGNLAAFLYRLKQTAPQTYANIVDTVRLVFPDFGDFQLQPNALNENSIILNWSERRNDYAFGPHQLSDGTLRVIALTVLLLQPADSFPDVIIIDEPELGLHPYAIGILASLIRLSSQYTQVVIATQSSQLLDEFAAEEVVVVNRFNKESIFQRLSTDRLSSWKDEYNELHLGHLWQRNVFGGGPH